MKFLTYVGPYFLSYTFRKGGGNPLYEETNRQCFTVRSRLRNKGAGFALPTRVNTRLAGAIAYRLL